MGDQKTILNKACVILQLVARGYYSNSHVVIMDCVTGIVKEEGRLDGRCEIVEGVARIPQEYVVERSKLMERQVRELLRKFVEDGVIELSDIAIKEQEAEDIGKVIKGREGKKKIRKKEIRTHYVVDPEFIVKTTELRLKKIKAQLNSKDDAEIPIYICPMTQTCQKKTYNMVADMINNEDMCNERGEWHCKYCVIMKDGKESHPLLKQRERAHAHGTSVVQKKKEFNLQSEKVFTHCKELSDLIKHQQQRKREDDQLNIKIKIEKNRNPGMYVGPSTQPKPKPKPPTDSASGVFFLPNESKHQDKTEKGVNRSNLAPLPWDYQSNEQLQRRQKEADITRIELEAEQLKRNERRGEEDAKSYLEWLDGAQERSETLSHKKAREFEMARAQERTQTKHWWDTLRAEDRKEYSDHIAMLFDLMTETISLTAIEQARHTTTMALTDAQFEWVVAQTISGAAAVIAHKHDKENVHMSDDGADSADDDEPVTLSIDGKRMRIKLSELMKNQALLNRMTSEEFAHYTSLLPNAENADFDYLGF